VVHHFVGVNRAKLAQQRARDSFNTSISSIFDYIEENGRRYHKYKDGSEYSPLFKTMEITSVDYLLPNDEVRPFL
jgi:hypothetical protein